MSNWTHVAGVVRVDSFRFIDSELNFDEIFGKEDLFESPEEVWEDATENPDGYLPMGSEGSLHKSIWVNPDKSQFCSYTVTIFGDLRDHHDPDEIIEWFKKKCKPLYIRNAVITVSNERNGTKTYTYTYEEESEEQE